MNKNRRKAIAAIVDKLDGVDLEKIQFAIQSIRDDENDYFDNMPESIREGGRGQASEAAIGCLDEAADKIGEAVVAILDAIASLEDAMSEDAP